MLVQSSSYHVFDGGDLGFFIQVVLFFWISMLLFWKVKAPKSNNSSIRLVRFVFAFTFALIAVAFLTFRIICGDKINYFLLALLILPPLVALIRDTKTTNKIIA